VGVERLSREALSRHQRARIIGAAIAVFAKRGYRATTIDNIVSAAGSSVGGFYGLFEGKEDCFLQTYETVIADARLRVEAGVPSNGSWESQLIAALIAILRAMEDDPFAARVAVVEVQTAGLVALERHQETLSSIVPFLRRGRSLLPSGNSLPPRLEDASIAGAAWLLRHRLVRGEDKGIITLLPECSAVLAGSYLGESRARRLGERHGLAIS
jgi:AcrR family transcriptional regulator